MRRPAARNILFALLPSVVVLLIGGGIGEIYLREQHAELRKSIEAKVAGRERCTRASADGARIYEGVPDKCGQNALGFRDTDHPLEKPAGVFRIAVIGDSVAMGQGVRPQESFAKVLEQKLRDDGASVEVLLLAVTGYSTSQELPLLEMAYRFHPDLILWTYVLNDPADPVIDNANGELGAYFHAPWSYALDYLGTLWTRSVLNFKGRGCPSEWHLRMHCLHRDDIERNFATIARSASKHGVPVVIAILPLLPEGAYRSYEYSSIHEDLRAMATAHGLSVADALAAFEGLDVETLRLTQSGTWRDPWHPNSRGHALIGEYLTGQLKDLVPGSKRSP